MKVIISNTVNKPLYEQIKEQIKEAIFKEELREGELMPSIRKFANELSVSVLTIRRVYDDLETEGFLISQVGIGTFVNTGNIEILIEAKRKQFENKIMDIIKEANSLNLEKKELIEIIEILYEDKNG